MKGLGMMTWEVHVNKFIEDVEVDTKDGPDWMFDADEKLLTDPSYVFCPANHWKAILHLFTKHFC